MILESGRACPKRALTVWRLQSQLLSQMCCRLSRTARFLVLLCSWRSGEAGRMPPDPCLRALPLQPVPQFSWKGLVTFPQDSHMVHCVEGRSEQEAEELARGAVVKGPPGVLRPVRGAWD